MNKAEKRYRAAHALKALGFTSKEIQKVLKLSQTTISVYLSHETYKELRDKNKARFEALEMKKRQPVKLFNRWFGSLRG